MAFICGVLWDLSSRSVPKTLGVNSENSWERCSLSWNGQPGLSQGRVDASGLSFPTWEWAQRRLLGEEEVKLAWGFLDLWDRNGVRF